MNDNKLERKKYFEDVCCLIKDCLSKHAKFDNEVPSSVGYNPKLIRGWMFFDNIVVVFFHCCINKRNNKSKLGSKNKAEHPVKVGNICQVIHLSNYHLLYDNTFLCDVIERFLNPGNAKCTTLEFLFIGEEFQNQDLSRIKSVGSSHLSLNTFVRLHYYGIAHVKCNDIYSKITQYQDRNNLEFWHAYIEADKYLTDFIFKEMLDVRLLYKGLNDWYNQIKTALGNNVWVDELQKSEPALTQWLNYIKQRIEDKNKAAGKAEVNLRIQAEALKKCMQFYALPINRVGRQRTNPRYNLQQTSIDTVENLKFYKEDFIRYMALTILVLLRDLKQSDERLYNFTIGSIYKVINKKEFILKLTSKNISNISLTENSDDWLDICKTYVLLCCSPRAEELLVKVRTRDGEKEVHIPFNYAKFLFDTDNYRDNFFVRVYKGES